MSRTLIGVGLGAQIHLYTPNYSFWTYQLYVQATVIIMSMDEGLQSSEVSVIKNARAVAKGKVTKYVNSLDITLVQNDDESFIYDEIDSDKVGDAHANLLSSYDKFQELHERYIDHASLESDENEKKYAKNVAEAFSAINRRYIKFNKSADKLKNEMKLTTLQKEVSRNRTSLEGKAAAANNIISAADENLKKTANVVKVELRSALDCYSARDWSLSFLKRKISLMLLKLLKIWWSSLKPLLSSSHYQNQLVCQVQMSIKVTQEQE